MNKITFYFFLVLLLLRFSSIHAQTYYTFQREILGFGTSTLPRNSCETFDGGCVMVGSSHLSAAETYVYVIKVDSMANVIWTIWYDEGNGMGYSVGYDIEQTKDSGYVITGSVGGYPNCLLSKISANGIIQWTNYFFIGNFYSHSRGVSVIQDQLNNFLIVGTVDSMTNLKSFIMKADSTGHTNWVKILSYDSLMNTTLDEIIISKEGNYLMSGTVSSGSQGGDPILINMDTSGVVLWCKKYDLTTQFFNASIRESPVDSNISLAAINSANPHSGALLKLNSHGDTIWTKSYDSYIRSFEIMSDNKYLLGGKQSTPGPYEMNCTKTDSAGNVEWSKSYCMDNGWIINIHRNRFISGYLYNPVYELFLIRTDPSGNNCLYNSETVTASNAGVVVIDSSLPSGYFSLTTDSLLSIYPQYHFQLYGGCSSYITNDIEESTQQGYSVSPNPFSSRLNLNFDPPQNENAFLKIINTIGGTVVEKQIKLEDQTVNLSELPEGIYFLSIQNGNGIFTKKILKK